MNRKRLVEVILVLALSLPIAYLLPKPESTFKYIFITFLFSTIIVATFYIVFFHYFHRLRGKLVETEYLEGTIIWCKSKLGLILALVLCLLIMAVLISLRFVQTPSPQGFDTPFYVYSLRQIYYGDFFSFLYHVHPLILLFFMPLAFIFGASPVTLGFWLPFVAGSIYVLLVFFSFYSLKKSVFYAALVTLFSFSNFFFVRLSYDLYSQLIFLGFFWLALAFFIKIFRYSDCSRVVNRKKYATAFFAVLLCLLFIDPTVSLITYVFFALVFFLSYRKQFSFSIFLGENKKKTVLILLFFILVICVILAFLVQTGYLINQFDLYSRIFGSELAPFRLSSSWDWIIFNETLPVLLLAFFACLYFIFNRKSFYANDVLSYLFLWSAFIFSFIFMTGYSQAYRFFILLPLSLIIGHFVYSFISSNLFKKFRKSKITAFLSVVGCFSVIFVVLAASFSSAYISAYVYYPNDSTIDALAQLGHEFKFGQTGVTYLVNNPSGFSSYWYYAYLGPNVFFGTVFDAATLNSSNRIFSNVAICPLNGLTKFFTDPLDGGSYEVNTKVNYLQYSETALLGMWSSNMVNVTSIVCPEEYFVWGHISVNSKGNSTNIAFYDQTNGVVGGLAYHRSSKLTVNECFSMLSGNFSAPLSIEFYNSGKFVKSLVLNDVPGKNCSVLHFGAITFDEYRLVFKGIDAKTTQGYYLESLSFGYMS